MPMEATKIIRGYHAHIYYRPETRDAAATLREQIDEYFDVRLGRWHDTPVGPHPIAMYQIAFEVAVFAGIVPWLMLNRQGLDILIHPETGDDLTDHRDNALWLGEKLPLKLALFEKKADAF